MIIATAISQAIEETKRWKSNGDSIGLVPTMGFFHDGHIALMHKSTSLAERTIATLFVNPRQFGPQEDLDNYPRDFDRDCDLAEKAGIDMLFCPSREEMYPPGYQTNITVDKLSQGLCGESRPGHFDGVATIITKLFNVFQPDIAVFGQKDYQQLALIKRLTTDLNYAIEIIGHPTVREEGGLAMSSRNRYLDTNEKKEACFIYQALLSAAEKVRGERRKPSLSLRQEIQHHIEKSKNCRVDYVSIVDAITLEEQSDATIGNVIATAVYFGEKVRLIDNIII